MKKKYKRKYLVDGKYQFGEAAMVVIANIISVLLAVFLVMWLYLIVWDGSMAINHNHKITQYITVSLLIVVILSICLSVRRSRSVAGMMKKLRIILTDAGRGIFPECTLAFRKSDYFRDIAIPLNECLDQFKKQNKKEDTVLLSSLEEIVDSIDKGETGTSGVKRSLVELIGTLKQGQDVTG